jgi:hypothetical protein
MKFAETNKLHRKSGLWGTLWSVARTEPKTLLLRHYTRIAVEGSFGCGRPRFARAEQVRYAFEL